MIYWEVIKIKNDEDVIYEKVNTNIRKRISKLLDEIGKDSDFEKVLEEFKNLHSLAQDYIALKKLTNRIFILTKDN